MLRWCLSTVRALGGGRDSECRSLSSFRQTQPYSRLSCYFRPLRFSRAYADAAVPVADLVGELVTSTASSSSAQSNPTSPQDALHLSFSSSAGLSEDRYPGRAACFRTSHSAIDTLRRFLSPENVMSDHPLIYSPTTIRSLYYRAESKNQLGMLDFKMITLLIGLFGSLSIDPRISVVYRVPLASRLFGMSTQRTHWTFVLKVGKYKLERGMPLQDSDRFWLMCAELAMVQAKPSARKSLFP